MVIVIVSVPSELLPARKSVRILLNEGPQSLDVHVDLVGFFGAIRAPSLGITSIFVSKAL